MTSTIFINPDTSLSIRTVLKKSNNEIFQEEFKQFALICIDNNCLTPKDACDYMIKINPNFKNDKIFNSLYPIIFNIEIIKRKMKNNNKN